MAKLADPHEAVPHVPEAGGNGANELVVRELEKPDPVDAGLVQARTSRPRARP